MLAGVRPEEAGDWGEPAPVAAVSFAASPDAQAQAVEQAIEQGRRVAARGGDAVVVVDTLEYLPPHLARRALAAARNIADGGSLTVIATAPTPFGGETTVVALDAQLTALRRFPALDLPGSGTLRAGRARGRGRRRGDRQGARGGGDRLGGRMVMHQPWDALEAPRFTGPRTFARLPHVTSLEGAHAAVFGMPWDGGTSFRSGARFGPEAVRSASGMIRTYNAVQRVQVFGELSTVDFGDAHTVPGYIEDTLERIEGFVRPIAEAGVIPLGIGGDHSVTLAELRALASVHGALGLLHFDSHTDLWDSYNGRPYSHGTMFRRAIEEGIVDPARTLQVGMRGPLYGADDEAIPGELGVETIPWHELAEWRPDALAEHARERLAGRPAFLTFDVDFVDPAFCPGTGTPEVGGPTSFEALKLLRACAGLPFVGFDVVEVAPAHDGPGQVTALFAANAIFEMLSFLALARRRARRSRRLSAQDAGVASASTSAKMSERIRCLSSPKRVVAMSSSERGRGMSTATTSLTRPGRGLIT